MKKLTIIIGFFLMAGCSGCMNKPEGEVTHKYNGYFEQYNRDMESLTGRQIDFSGLTVREANGLNDDGRPVVGHCYDVKNQVSGLADISFDKKMEQLPEACKLAVVYHEIGHCYLGLGHNSGIPLMIEGDLCPDVIAMSGGNPGLNYLNRIRLLKEMLNAAGY